jgi:hypothetical protein
MMSFETTHLYFSTGISISVGREESEKGLVKEHAHCTPFHSSYLVTAKILS